MIRVRHASLPPGLSALARRGPGDELAVYVSDSLPPERQRAAVRVALRAGRGHGWRAVPLPLGVAGLLPALVRAGLHRVGHALHGYAVVWGTAAAVLAAGTAAVYVTVLPHGHSVRHVAEPSTGMTVQPPGAAVPPAHSSAPARRSRPSHGQARQHATSVIGHGGSQSALGHGGTTLTTGHGSGSPGTPPSPGSGPGSSPSPTPHPSPTSAPPGPRGRHCIINLLGIKVCVG